MLVNLISALILGFVALVIADITNDICNSILYPTPTVVNVPSYEPPVIAPVFNLPVEEIVAQVEDIKYACFDTIQAEIEALVVDESESVEHLDYSLIGRERFLQSLPSYKVTQLKELAKHRNVDKVYKLNKAQLVNALS